MENTGLKWREAFTFSRSEKRGLRLLTIILFLSVVFRVSYFRMVKPSAVQFKIPAAWLASDTLKPSQERDYSKPWSHSERNEDEPKQKGYGKDSVPAGRYDQPFKRSRIIELNTADTFELRGLPSIGPWLARKIVDYRERLGGFYDVEQLLEVYRLTPGKLDTIAPYLVIDTSMVTRLDINSIALDELFKHPYFSRSQAKGLLAYRDKHGPFASVLDLKKCLLIDEKTFEKVRDYVEVR